MSGAPVPIRVVIADDQALLRGGFKALLQSAPGVEVVGEAADGYEAVAAARARLPDVVLMDIRMPRMDGLEATRQICSDPTLGNVKVLIVTTFETDEYIYEALRSGASGFLVKDTEPAELVQAVEVVARGDALLSPSVTKRLVADIAGRRLAQSPHRSPGGALQSLTERERDVVALVAQGLSNDEVAAKLYLSPLTAKTHVSRSMSKLGARDRANWS